MELMGVLCCGCGFGDVCVSVMIREGRRQMDREGGHHRPAQHGREKSEANNAVFSSNFDFMMKVKV
jgi:hypothetical protein